MSSNNTLSNDLLLLLDESKLDTDELEVVTQVLSELADTGQSTTLNNIWSADYEEVPVDIETFITDRRYLGNTFINDDGEVLIYPFWIEKLKEVFKPES